MVHSKHKGARGERELAQAFTEATGIEARRGQQFSGSEDSPDVVTGCDEIHFEVKRTEALRLYDAIKQAKEDCGDKSPVVAHKRNRDEWYLTIPLSELCRVVDHVYWSRLDAELQSKGTP